MLFRYGGAYVGGYGNFNAGGEGYGMGSGMGRGVLRAMGGPLARFPGGGRGGRRGRARGNRGPWGGRGRGRGNNGAPPLNAKAAGGDWSNVFNPEIFQAMKNAEEAGLLQPGPNVENKEDSDSDDDFKGVGFTSQSQPKSSLEEKQKKEATLANIMKMVEEEKVSEELKKAREEVEDTRYTSKTTNMIRFTYDT